MVFTFTYQNVVAAISCLSNVNLFDFDWNENQSTWFLWMEKARFVQSVPDPKDYHWCRLWRKWILLWEWFYWKGWNFFLLTLKFFTYFWNFQCYRITAKMDIAYTARLDEKDIVVHRRNMTVGVGCGCKAMRIRRFMQVRALHIDDEKWAL